MSVRDIKDARDLETNELVYLKGHAKATFLSDGSTVEDVIKNIKERLNSLSNYDDTTVLQKVGELEEALNTLISGNSSSAIESFNEVINFLKGYKDSNKLSSIITGIEESISTLINQLATTNQALAGKQATLVSGNNIKTLNDQSLLGSGNITIDTFPDGTPREVYITQQTGVFGNRTQSITSEQREYNAQTALMDKVYLTTGGTVYSQILTNSGTNLTEKIFAAIFSLKAAGISKPAIYNIVVNSNGDALCNIEYLEVPTSLTIDSALSTASENPVQNKIVTAALNNKVEKVSGKQLSTEDFTTALKNKLASLSNYDDTAIQNAITSLTNQLNTLVSGNASDAINSFNEIIAFLDGLKDNQDLESIIANIEQQIAAKQAQLVSGTNIKTVNGLDLLGEGNLEIVPEIEIDAQMSDTSTNTVQNRIIKTYVDDQIGELSKIHVGSDEPEDPEVEFWIDPETYIGAVNLAGTVTVDAELSESSINPVQNRVIYQELERRFAGIDSILDTINGEL